MNSIEMVGSSMRIGGSASGATGSAMVSPIWISGMPAIATISPAAASSTPCRLRPSNVSRRVTFQVCTAPSSLRRAIGSPMRMRPRVMRPMAIRPT